MQWWKERKHMEKSVVLSIIVPVYNVEKYLPICLDSIINQTYKNWELIIVDDASTDKSPEIIRKYTSYANNITAIMLKENVGVGNARNVGMEIARGQYIGFVDSDDWIDNNYYQQLIDRIIDDKSEIAVCGVKTEYSNSKSSSYRYKYMSANCISHNYALRLLVNSQNIDQFISPIVSNKIYQTSFLKNNMLYFDPSRSFQDDYFSFFCMLYAHNVSIVPDVYYHYFQRPDSVTHVFSKKLVNDCLDILIQIKERLRAESLLNSYNQEYYSFFERCLSSLLNMLHSREHDTYIQKKYLEYIFIECFKRFSAKEVIQYLDNQRIFDFFHI